MNFLNPEHVPGLKRQADNPAYLNPPAAVNNIMGTRDLQAKSVQTNDAALQRLRSLNTNDPQVQAAINAVESSTRTLKAKHGSEITQAVREFKDTKAFGNKTVLEHFSTLSMVAPLQTRYRSAINHLETQIGAGVSKAQAMKEALDILKPTTGAAGTQPNQSTSDYIGE